MINWKVSDEDRECIEKVAQRAWRKAWVRDAYGKRPYLEMDILATHASNALRLPELLAAEECDFAHDLIGISVHLDRETGKLLDCFRPRFSA